MRNMDVFLVQHLSKKTCVSGTLFDRTYLNRSRGIECRSSLVFFISKTQRRSGAQVQKNIQTFFFKIKIFV